MTELTKLSPELESSILLLEDLLFIVENLKSRNEVVASGRKAKAIKASVVGFFKESKEYADKAHKAICANEKFFTVRCNAIEEKAKNAVTKWDDEQKVIREKERASLQAIEDERVRKEQERLMKQADKIKSPERSEALMEEAASIVAPVVQVAEQEKNKGEATKRVWKYRVIDPDKVPRDWWILDDKGLAAFARATKGNKKVEGIEFYPVSSLAIAI